MSSRAAAPRFAMAVLALTAAAASAQQSPLRLSRADGPALDGAAYSLSFLQDVAIETGADTHIMRESRLRFRFVSGSSADGGRASAALTFDSARAAVTSPHGREVRDARPLVGTSTRLSWNRTTGDPEWQAPVPEIDYGDFGGTMPVSVLIDQALPAMSADAVGPGGSWEAESQRRRIDGNTWTIESVVTRYTLEDVERVNGAAVARVAFTMRRPSSRTLEASGSFVIGVDDGVVRTLELEERVPGTWSFGGEALPFVQTTTLRLDLVAHGAGNDLPGQR